MIGISCEYFLTHEFIPYSSRKNTTEQEENSSGSDSDEETANKLSKDKSNNNHPSRADMPAHCTDEDELDLFIQQSLSKEKACASFSSKVVRKNLLKLVIEGDLLEVSLDEQQLLASLWYLLNKWKRDPLIVTSVPSTSTQDDGQMADSLSEMSD